MHTGREKLLAEIEAFLLRHSMAAARFGQLACGDMGFVLRMRRGRNVRLDTSDKVREFMRTYQSKKGRGSLGPKCALICA